MYARTAITLAAEGTLLARRRTLFLVGLRGMSSWWRPAEVPNDQQRQLAQQQAQQAQAQANYQARSQALSQAQIQATQIQAAEQARRQAEAVLMNARVGGVPEALPPVPKPAAASGPLYMPLNLYYPGLQKVFDSPPIYIVDNFLTDEECDTLIETARPLLQRSKTHAIAGARRARPRPIVATSRCDASYSKAAAVPQQCR